MHLVDMKERWVYKGSVTTPPCATYVFWNVLKTIYPIKQAHLDLFKAQLARGSDGKLKDWGNWREVQEVDDHNVVSIRNSSGAGAASGAAAYNININIYNQNSGVGSCPS